MSLPVQTANNVQIYNVTGQNHSRLPAWLLQRHSKKLKKDSSFSRRVQLIQDFDFPEASLRLAMTRDAQHIVATGVYKPQLRVYELAEAAMKFERHTAAENVAMQLLGDDWRKLALLQSDRYLSFHSSSGIYHSTRIPKVHPVPVACSLSLLGRWAGIWSMIQQPATCYWPRRRMNYTV